MPTEAEVQRFYAGQYRHAYHGSTAPRARAVARALDGAAARSALLCPHLASGARSLDVDVGAASGELVACLAGRTARRGAGAGRPVRAVCARSYGIDVVNACWERARFAPGSIDLITAIHVLEHFRDPAAALARFAEWLAPGGHVYLSVPNVHASHRSPMSRFHFAHLFGFNRGSPLMLARRASLTPVPGWPEGPTDVLFVKATEPYDGPPAAFDPDAGVMVDGADNYRLLRRHFDEHTVLRYHFTATPYRRIVRKLGGIVAEYRRLRGVGSAHDVAARLR